MLTPHNPERIRDADEGEDLRMPLDLVYLEDQLDWDAHVQASILLGRPLKPVRVKIVDGIHSIPGPPDVCEEDL